MFRRCVVAYAVFVGFSALCGCGKKPDPNETSPTVLYDQHCAKCHARAGEPQGPGIGGSKGPSLAKIGTEHDADWLFRYIREPKSVKPDSQGARMMPAFKDTLSDEQIRVLAEHLAAKK